MLFVFIVPEANTYICERLGVFHRDFEPGLHFIIPFVDRITKRISRKEQLADFPPQNIITKDNCLVMVDTVIFYRVQNPKLFSYGISDPVQAIYNLSATILRNCIGSMTMEEATTSREKINIDMRESLDLATDPWGIKISRVEIKDINPPEDVKNAMEKQIKAEREKRATILQAEAEKQSAILRAEGNREAKILTARADKDASILEAEGYKVAKILEAEAQAEAIEKVQAARAKGIELISKSNPSEKYIELQQLETWTNVANGTATKIIIPSNMQGLSSMAATFKEIANTETTEPV